MANVPGTTIHWANELVEHFSNFFAGQWDRIVANSIADAKLPWQDTVYTIATLQEILDCITQGSQQAVSKGFSPSLHYRKTLPTSAEPPYSPASLVVMRDILERILATDRRHYSGRNGLSSCGDFWFHGIRLALQSELPVDCLDDHAATAQYFGRSGYSAMLCAGRSADSLRQRVLSKDRLALTPAAIADLGRFDAEHQGLEFRHLRIIAEPGTTPRSLERCSFADCEFSSWALDALSQASLEHCRLMADTARRYKHVRFANCSMQAPAGEAAGTAAAAEVEASGLEFTQCRFDTPLFDAHPLHPHLLDCEFAANRLQGLTIASLSGDYSQTDIDQCEIADTLPGTRIGRLTNSVVGYAGQTQFCGDLKNVTFSHGATDCTFGDQHVTRMARVRFGCDNKDQANNDDQVIDCSFAKRLHLAQVSFHCLLQDPEFLGTTTGIDSIQYFRATKPFRPSLTSIEFGRINTLRKGIIYNIIGGSIVKLDAHVEHVSHTVIKTLAKHARIGTYEIIMDRQLRKEWHIKSNPTLIGKLAGRIDHLGFMGSKCGEYFVDEVTGEIGDLHHCIKIRSLKKGAKIVFSKDTDIEAVFTKRQILKYSGGEFGVWEQQKDKKSIHYFYSEEDYQQRSMIDSVRDIFDTFE
jgi:hypothetical protein